MPHKLIIDCDPGVDDTLAILLAFASPEVELEAITAVHGNTDVDAGYANILRIAKVLSEHLERSSPSERKRFVNFAQGKKPVVARGAAQPIGGDAFTASYFHGKDGLSGVSAFEPFSLPDHLRTSSPHLDISPLPSHRVILSILASNLPGTVSIAAIGPLTNLALAQREDPAIFARVGSISVMGGALDVPGNTTAVAEFNWFADPFAARQLCNVKPRLAIVLVPLDITTSHSVPFHKLVDTKSPSPSLLRAFVSSFLQSPRQFMKKHGEPDAFQCHDPLAVAYAIFNPPRATMMDGEATVKDGKLEGGWKVRRRKFGVEASGELTRGMCVVDRRYPVDSTSASLSSKEGINCAHKAARLSAGHVPPTQVADANAGTLHLTKASQATLEAEDERLESSEEDAGMEVLVETPGVGAFEQLFLESVFGA